MKATRRNGRSPFPPPHSLRPFFKQTLPRRSRKRRSKRGSVLIAVLGIILLLSFIVTKIVDEAVEDLEYASIFNEPGEVRSFAYSMLEVALATIHEVAIVDEGALYAPEQGWGNPLNTAGIEVPDGWEVSVRISDEGGRLPLNTMAEDDLNRLLESAFDIDFGTARELSSTLYDWIDENDLRRLNGAESDVYMRRDPPYRAANAPLQSLEELSLIEGWDETFFDENGQPLDSFDRLSAMVSVETQGAANLNSAPPEVLDYLGEQDGFDEKNLFDNLLDVPYFTELPPSVEGGQLGVTAGPLKVEVSIRRGAANFSVYALVEYLGSSGASVDSGRTSRDSDRRTRESASASTDAERKTGTTEEQSALNYPFKILRLTEHDQGSTGSQSARYSALDIEP